MRAGSYAPIVGSGINSTTLHYSENSATCRMGIVVLVDAACEYSMYASRHYADGAGERPLHGAAAGDLRHRSGRAEGGDRRIRGGQVEDQRPRPQGSRLARHRGLQLHQHARQKTCTASRWGSTGCTGWDTWWASTCTIRPIYPAVLKPGMVFTIEPGVYIPEEKTGRAD